MVSTPYVAKIWRLFRVDTPHGLSLPPEGKYRGAKIKLETQDTANDAAGLILGHQR